MENLKAQMLFNEMNPTINPSLPTVTNFEQNRVEAVTKGVRKKHLHWCNTQYGMKCNCSTYKHKPGCASLKGKK